MVNIRNCSVSASTPHLVCTWWRQDTCRFPADRQAEAGACSASLWRRCIGLSAILRLPKSAAASLLANPFKPRCRVRR